MPARIMKTSLEAASAIISAFHRSNETRKVLEKDIPGSQASKGLQLSVIKGSHVAHVYVFGKRHGSPSDITLV